MDIKFDFPDIEWLKAKSKEGLFREIKEGIQVDQTKINNSIIYYLSNNPKNPSYKISSFKFIKKYHKKELFRDSKDFNEENNERIISEFESGEVYEEKFFLEDLNDNIHIIKYKGNEKEYFLKKKIVRNNKIEKLIYNVDYKEYEEEIKPEVISFFKDGTCYDFKHDFIHYPYRMTEENGFKNYIYKNKNIFDFITENIKNPLCFSKKEYELFLINKI